jgi:epoxyqueuosine reductase QueG
MTASATGIVRAALGGTGLDLVASCPIEAYNARAPRPLRSLELMPRARGIVVVGSAGRALWMRFEAALKEEAELRAEPHPLESFVARSLDRADVALADARIGSRRFEPTLEARPRLDFRAIGELSGLGSLGPFGLLIHSEHGPWWALRAAYMVDVAVDPPLPHKPPCLGCAAPCVGGDPRRSPSIELATPETRARCIVGRASQYSEAQIDYHYRGVLKTG